MDIEKAIQFLIEQQARLDAEFNAKLDAHKARFEEEMSKVNSVLVDLATAQERTNAILTTLVEKHVELAESHKRSAESHERLAESHERLAESHERSAESDERLAESQQRLAESHERLAKSHEELAEGQKAIQHALLSLASTVEHHIATHK
jgi:DNA repair exonuclease SbcCD ATPase subunit